MLICLLNNKHLFTTVQPPPTLNFSHWFWTIHKNDLFGKKSGTFHRKVEDLHHCYIKRAIGNPTSHSSKNCSKALNHFELNCEEKENTT